ncbi:hypothetical protein [Mucilaginibacter ginkgonis]|uniref:Uncharacterized protein n=1 Tax=Mucilaginibacter ginkgonis TaxID=2682091 RepID=A0A6I4HYG1_9SPHI|nr:hypothetical protein [Mucilaginibacter ginkgonis]QQL49504.1 hypothetical protein GO620_015220 [Mucilaginibacter ginkgonis]
MKKISLGALALILMSTLSGCGLMEDAFKAGVIFALIIAAIIGAIIWALNFTICQVKKRYRLQTVPVKVRNTKPGL